MVNPYSVSSQAPLESGVFGDLATRQSANFLYRVIEISHPLPMEFVYDGWWFRQKIAIDGVTVWWRISWLLIMRKATFKLPAEIDAECREGKMEIDFASGLRIRRFRIWIADELIYDEVN